MICQCLAGQLFASAFGVGKYIDLLATDKSRYFAQPRPIIVNYFVPKALSIYLRIPTKLIFLLVFFWLVMHFGSWRIEKKMHVWLLGF